MNRVFCFFLVLSGVVAGHNFAGTIEGTVKLPPRTAPAPAPARYQMTTAGTVGTVELPGAVVYLEGDFGAVQRTNATPPQLQQKTFQFSPALLAVQKGATVEFPNLDSEYHNVLSYSKTKRFDLGRYRPDEKPPVITFDQAGVVRLRCEIHEHMRATILVLETPHFATTEAGGRYRLTNVPPGKYTLKAWLDEKKILERPVEIAAEGVSRVDFAP